MEAAIAALNELRSLSENLKTHLNSILKRKLYLKREALLREGEVCRKLWFIESGIAGCFYERNDKQLCSWFMKEFDIITSVTSFFHQQKSVEEIIALSDLITWWISFEELQYVYEKFPEFNFHGRMLVTKYYILAEQRMQAFNSMSPRSKYRFLLDNQPEMLQRVSVKDLSKFIGVSPNALSRIRTQV